MPTILGRLTGVPFQTELLVMTFLGLVNSTFSWSFYDWTILVEKITNMPLNSKYFGEIAKTILRWVVIARIIIAHLYTVTYLANFYSILTWCRPKILLPWMIVSGFKNFLLEFVVIMVCLLLYFEREFSRGRLAVFIVCKVLYLVPAIYYWRTVKAFFVELTEIQRRKLTRANLMTNTNGNTSRSLDVVERLRFRSAFAASFAYKQQRFMSLVNLDDLLFNSSIDISGERDYYKLTKSLATLITIDSQEFEESEDDSRLQIIEDTTLTPVEKSMKILGVNRDDINDTRIRLGKNVLLNTSGVEEIEEIISTVEPKENIEAIDYRSINNATKDLSIATETLVETSSPPLNVLPDYQSSLRETSKLSEINPQQRCTCGKANEKSVDERILDSRGSRKRSLISDSREAGSRGYEDEDDDDATKNVTLSQPHRLSSKKRFKSESKIVSSTEKLSSNDFPQSHLCKNGANIIGKSEESETMILPQQVKERRVTLGSLIIPGFEKKQIGWLKSSLLYPEDPKRMTVEIFRVDDISLEQDKQTDDNSEASGSEMDTSRSYDLQTVPSLFRIDGNRRVVHTQTDLVNNAEECKSDYCLDKAECSSSATKRSTSTQTNISDCWKKTIFQRSPNVSNNHNKDFFASKPSNVPPSIKETLFVGMPTFCKPKKRQETVEEREARHMRALRVYNRQTLFKYKREMEAKKQDSAPDNRTELQSLIFAANPTNSIAKDTREVSIAPQRGTIVNEKTEVKSNKIPKRRARSRPHQQSSKLKTFNMGLDALEYSISLSFSNGNKNRSTPRVERSNEISSSAQQDGRRQLSKYSKPMRIPEGPSVSSRSIRRFEGLQKGRNLERTPGAENLTGRSTTQQMSRHIGNSRIETIQTKTWKVPSSTMFSSLDNEEHSTASIAETNDKPAIHDKYGISSLKETIKNIDWGFNEHHESVINDSPPEDNVISNNEDVLYDIIDDTDVISLLRSAFASNPENTDRGFYLGPGSTVLYSVSNYLDNVVEEIMKTARLSPNRDVFSSESSTEVDYGLSYLEEFQDAQLLALEAANDEETDSDNESSDGIKVEDLTTIKPAEFDRSVPIEMCCSSYSSEGLYTRNRQQLAIEDFDLSTEKNENARNIGEEYPESLASNNLYVSRDIADLLGDREISHLEFWTNELKDLASYDRRNDMEFVQKFRHMTEMPGYCVVKTLVDFFRDFVAVSRSTMTSRMFLRGNAVSDPNSMQSEEIISSAFNDRSNTSLINDTMRNSQNGTFIEAIDDDVAISLRTLIDRMMESAEDNNPLNVPIVGIHDDRTTFPLPEDQFYFGTPENTRRIITENLFRESKSELLDCDFICNEDIEAFNIAKQQTPPANTFEVCAIMNASPEVHNSEMVSSINPEGLLEIDSKVDSYDSFYSTGATETSKPSDNAISIGGYSSFEDFAESPLNASDPLESQSPSTGNPHPPSENQ